MLFSAHAFGADAAFDANALDQVIRDHRAEIHSVADLPGLRRYLPLAFRQHRTYAFGSDSAQPGKPDQPREIYFGPNVMMSLRGGSDHIEVIGYDGRPPRYRFYEYAFRDGQLGKRQEITRDGSNAPGTVNCFACHQNGKPIFPEYHTWCGFFGQHDDILYGNESRLFARFLQTQTGEFAKSPYFLETPLSMSEAEGKKEFRREKSQAMNDYRNIARRPNLLLNKYLARQNGRIVADQILAAPQIDNGFIRCCTSDCAEVARRRRSTALPPSFFRGFWSRSSLIRAKPTSPS